MGYRRVIEYAHRRVSGRCALPAEGVDRVVAAEIKLELDAVNKDIRVCLPEFIESLDIYVCCAAFIERGHHLAVDGVQRGLRVP